MVWAFLCSHVFPQVLVPEQSMHVFFYILCYLTVMRTKETNERYAYASRSVVHLQCQLRDMVRMVVALVRDQDEYIEITEDLETEERLEIVHEISKVMPDTGFSSKEWMDGIEKCWTDTCRLAIALLLTVHMRALFGYRRALNRREMDLDDEDVVQLSFNRARLRGLLNDEEFGRVDRILGALEIVSEQNAGTMNHQSWTWKDSRVDLSGNQTIFNDDVENVCEIFVAVAQMLSSSLRRHIIGYYGFHLRAFDLLDKKLRYATALFDDIEDNFIVTTPIGFAQISKQIITVLIVTLPLALEAEAGFLSNVLFPGALAMFFILMERTAIDMEVIFGTEKEHIDILQSVNELEKECLTMLKLGEMDKEKRCGIRPRVLDRFVWVKFPHDYSCKRESRDDFVDDWDRTHCSREIADAWGLALRSEAEVVEKLYLEIVNSLHSMQGSICSSTRSHADARRLMGDTSWFEFRNFEKAISPKPSPRLTPRSRSRSDAACALLSKQDSGQSRDHIYSGSLEIIEEGREEREGKG
jgi:predicted membrane chloride channel (bestrophin family)